MDLLVPTLALPQGEGMLLGFLNRIVGIKLIPPPWEGVRGRSF
jgi:hypothetical protein